MMCFWIESCWYLLNVFLSLIFIGQTITLSFSLSLTVCANAIYNFTHPKEVGSKLYRNKNYKSRVSNFYELNIFLFHLISQSSLIIHSFDILESFLPTRLNFEREINYLFFIHKHKVFKRSIKRSIFNKWNAALKSRLNIIA